MTINKNVFLYLSTSKLERSEQRIREARNSIEWDLISRKLNK
jgi:hypothetical protein